MHDGQAEPGPTDCELLAFENDPAGQGNGVAEPVGQYDPGGHAAQLAAWKILVEDENDPAGHG